jgi:hypothetical protein
MYSGVEYTYLPNEFFTIANFSLAPRLNAHKVKVKLSRYAMNAPRRIVV